MSLKPTAVLTEAQVIEILQRLEAGEHQQSIATYYKVSTKTISRIKTGDTWSDVTQRYRVRDPWIGSKLPVVRIIPTPASTIDLIDEVVAVKNHFGLRFEYPIYWGWFNSWDGLHSVVSDGIIMWESVDLVSYAQKLAKSGINESPIWADRTDEIPTFDIEDILTHPIGKKLKIDVETGETVQLSCSNESPIYLHPRFINISKRMKLDIRQAGEQQDYVYLTKLKPKSPSDPMHIVIACVATIKETLL
jgi:hypothetical protein